MAWCCVSQFVEFVHHSCCVLTVVISPFFSLSHLPSLSSLVSLLSSLLSSFSFLLSSPTSPFPLSLLSLSPQDQAAKEKAIAGLSSMSSAQIVSASILQNTASARMLGTPGITGNAVPMHTMLNSPGIEPGTSPLLAINLSIVGAILLLCT